MAVIRKNWEREVCLMDGLRGVFLDPFPTQFPLMYNGCYESLAPLFADSNQSAPAC